MATIENRMVELTTVDFCPAYRRLWLGVRLPRRCLWRLDLEVGTRVVMNLG